MLITWVHEPIGLRAYFFFLGGEGGGEGVGIGLHGLMVLRAWGFKGFGF